MEELYWHWWIASLVFVILAILAMPMLLIFGAAAAVMGFIVYFLPTLSWPVKIILFGLMSTAVIPLRQYYRRINPLLTDNPHLNRRSDRHIGSVLVLDQPIKGGAGRTSINGISWRIMGEDLPAGQKVRVVRADGASLVVEAVDSRET